MKVKTGRKFKLKALKVKTGGKFLEDLRLGHTVGRV